MAKLRGPMHSQRASGSLDDKLIFSSHRGRQYVKRHTFPTNPKTGLQTSARAMLAFLSQRWSSLTTNQKTTWDNAYPQTNLSAYNAFTKHNLQRWQNLLTPTRSFPATETGLIGNPPVGNANGGVNHIIIDARILLNLRDTWCVLLFHKFSDWPGFNFNQLVHIIPIFDLCTQYWTHSQLQAGTHFYHLYWCQHQGHVFPHPMPRQAVVTD